MNGKLDIALIPLDNISIPQISLRDVNKESEVFKNLVQSIYSFGVIQTITVIKDPTDKKKFILEDGKHRVTASLTARDLAKEKNDEDAIARTSVIPARIQDHSIEEVPFFQIQANLHRVETRPTEFARQIKRIWATPKFAAMTKQQLMAHLGITKSLAWFETQLGLANLIPEAEEALESGQFPASSAYMLAKLPAEEQIVWIDRAKSEKVEDFTAAVANRLTELKNAAKGIKKEKDPLDDIKPRKKGEFRKKIESLLEKENVSPEDKAFTQGVLWGCEMDEETQSAKQAEEKKEKELREKKMKLRREKLLAMQKQAMPEIDAEIMKELNLPQS